MAGYRIQMLLIVVLLFYFGRCFIDSDKIKSSFLDVFNVFLQIRREVATMKLIKHPNVVRLYEVSLSLSVDHTWCNDLPFSFLNDFFLYFILVWSFSVFSVAVEYRPSCLFHWEFFLMPTIPEIVYEVSWWIVKVIGCFERLFFFLKKKQTLFI